MKGTQLWQEAGSPIIRGRSRRLRPFWQPWLTGSAVALVAIGLVMAPRVIAQGTLAMGRLGGSGTATVAAVPGALLGAALGAWIARGAGWRGAWAYSAIGGVVLGGLSVWLLGGVLTG